MSYLAWLLVPVIPVVGAIVDVYFLRWALRG
jgi:hypothetical protein